MGVSPNMFARFVLLACFCSKGYNLTTLRGSSSGQEAIVVSGGVGDENAGTNVEVILPKTGQFCALPPLPYSLAEHTMSGLYLCGGGGSSSSYHDSCLFLD